MSYLVEEIEEYLETIFPECKKSLRVVFLFLTNPDETYTKYMIQKLTAVDKIGKVLERLLKLGVIEKVDEDPAIYRLNLKNEYASFLYKFFIEKKG